MYSYHTNNHSNSQSTQILIENDLRVNIYRLSMKITMQTRNASNKNMSWRKLHCIPYTDLENLLFKVIFLYSK